MSIYEEIALYEAFCKKYGLALNSGVSQKIYEKYDKLIDYTEEQLEGYIFTIDMVDRWTVYEEKMYQIANELLSEKKGVLHLENGVWTFTYKGVDYNTSCQTLASAKQYADNLKESLKNETR